MAENVFFKDMVRDAPAATIPLGMDDLVPVIQGGVTKSFAATGGGIGMLTNASNASIPSAPTNLLGNATMHTYPAQGYGSSTWDNAHDVSAAINLAIVAASNGGGGIVLLPAGTFGLLNTITLLSNVVLVGAGSAGANQSATELLWLGNVTVGTLGGTMLRMGASAGNNVLHPGIMDLSLDGNSLADTGVEAWSVLFGTFHRVIVSATTNIGWLIDQTTVGGTNANSHLSSYQHITIDQGANGAPSINAKCLVFGINNLATDASENTFVMLHCKHQNGTGIEIGSGDSNQFFGVWSQAIGGGTTGKGIVFKGANTLGQAIGATGNFMYSVAAGNGSHLQGGVWAEAGTVMDAANNVIVGLKTGDGEPNPVDQTAAGTGIFFMNDQGYFNGRPRLRNPSSNFSPTGADSGSNISTNGASVGQNINLPPALGLGANYTFAVTDQLITINANGTNVIWVGGKVTGAGGSIIGGLPGHSLSLISVKTGEWVARWVVGRWSINTPVIVTAINQNPAAITSATAEMLGLGANSGATITPLSSGAISVTVYGDIANSGAAGSQCQIGLYWGTGTPPANGAAPPGGSTLATSRIQMDSSGAGRRMGFSLSFDVLLAPGTTYWFDAAVNAAAGTVTATDVGFTASEPR